MSDRSKNPGINAPALSHEMDELSTSRRVCVLVLGMHRSGTSALTRLLGLAGAGLPTNILGANAGNETGHWEPITLINYHDALLAELGSSWHDWRSLNISRLLTRRRTEIVSEISTLLAAEYASKQIIVVKEPRICRFAPLFLDGAKSAGYDVCVALTFRNPLEVVASLEARDGLGRAEAALLWLRYALESEFSTREAKRVITSYHELLDDWRGPLSRIIDCVDGGQLYGLEDIAPQVERFLSPTQRHHNHTLEEVLLDPCMRTWIAECFEAMLILERNPSSQKALGVLDRVRDEFDCAAPVLEFQLADVKRIHETKVKALAGSLTAAEADANQLRNELSERIAELDQNRASQAERDAETDELRKVLQNREAESNRLATELAAVKAAAEEQAELVRAMLQNRDNETAQRGAEVDELRKVLENQEAESNRLAIELAASKATAEDQAELARAMLQDCDNLRAELEQARNDASRLGLEQTRRATESAELTAALADQQAVASRLQAELDICNKSHIQVLAQLMEKFYRELSEKEQLADRIAAASQTIAMQEERLLRTGQELIEAERAKNAALTALSGQLSKLEAAQTLERLRASELEQNIASYERRLEQEHANAKALTEHFRNSTSWKLTAPLRAVRKAPIALSRIGRTIPATARIGGGVMPATRKALRVLRQEGFKGVAWRWHFAANTIDAAKIETQKKKENNNPRLDYPTPVALVTAPTAPPVPFIEPAPSIQHLPLHSILKGFFDTDWYVKRNLSPISAGRDLDPIDHYIDRGDAIGLAPHPWFRPTDYYSLFDDAARSGRTSLEHFLDRVKHAEDIGTCPSRELRLALRDMLELKRRRAGSTSASRAPDVSFVIPIFNGGAFLEDAVISALLSTDRPSEIIITNDGSSDPFTIAELRRIEAVYGIIVVHKENGGLSSARNAGAARVTSQAVKFLDCDDLLWPGSVDKQLEQLEGHSAPLVSIGEYHFCRSDGGHWIGPESSTIAPYEFTEPSFFINWENGFSVPIHCALFPTEIIRSHAFTESVRAKEDWLFWMEISAAGWTAAYLPNLVALYRIHSTNMCSNPEVMGLEYLKAALYHSNHDEHRARHVVNHFARAYLNSIKAAAIAQTQLKS